jgi:hypothetical protein
MFSSGAVCAVCTVYLGAITLELKIEYPLLCLIVHHLLNKSFLQASLFNSVHYARCIASVSALNLLWLII